MDIKKIKGALVICGDDGIDCSGCPYVKICDDRDNALKEDALGALDYLEAINIKLKAENAKLEEGIDIFKKLNDEKQTQIEALHQSVNELENKLAAMQKDERYHEKEISAAELLRNREAEIEELRRYMWRLESDNRAFQEAIAALTLERLGIKDYEN